MMLYHWEYDIEGLRRCIDHTRPVYIDEMDRTARVDHWLDHLLRVFRFPTSDWRAR